MEKKHFSEEQIAFVLRQAESGTSVAEIIRKLGISEQTFYRWKKRFAGLGIAERRACRVQFGYPRLWVLLRREGWLVNKKLVYRLYCEEGLGIMRKKPRRRKSVLAARGQSPPCTLST